ncbi:NADH:flavin oxidoreductase, partial [Verrucomicrobiota bacterium]
VILVGGLRSLDVMQRVLDDGVCDMVSVCRPLIREPELINAFREGQARKSACISCNKCFNPRGFLCIFTDVQS